MSAQDTGTKAMTATTLNEIAHDCAAAAMENWAAEHGDPAFMDRRTFAFAVEGIAPDNLTEAGADRFDGTFQKLVAKVVALAVSQNFRK